MGWSKKKADPITDRARALNEQIAALEAQIKQLGGKVESPPARPRLRSTALPPGGAAPSTPATREPIFEKVDQNRLQSQESPATKEQHYNDLGIRKYDLAALFHRIKNHFRGPPTANPKLVNYLAAGSIQGLRPMRYERRVARNRFLVIVVVIVIVLVWILSILLTHR